MTQFEWFNIYEHNNIHILNGLGTRGVMLAPTMAKNLFEYIEFSKPIDSSINIKRFYKKMNLK